MEVRLYRPIKRGELVKLEDDKSIVLFRQIMLRKYVLKLDKEKCVGCGICTDMCPKWAITYYPAKFDGIKRVSERPRIDFDSDKCVLCGTCVTVCPMRAITLTLNEEEWVPVMKNNVFYTVAVKALEKRYIGEEGEGASL